MSHLFGSGVNAPVLSEIKVGEITPDPNQPRKYFEKSALAELAQTIKDEGLIQPIVVRTNPDGDGFLIIAGERRYRAAVQVGLETMPAIVRDDLNARTASIIENIQRVNLKPIEEADAIAQLIEEENVSQGDVGGLIGKSRTTVNQMLKLRDLPEKIRKDSIVMDTPKSILVELSKLKDKKVVDRLWKKNKKAAISSQEIRRAGQKKPSSEGETLTKAERALERAEGSIAVLRGVELNDQERERLNGLRHQIDELL